MERCRCLLWRAFQGGVERKWKVVRQILMEGLVASSRVSRSVWWRKEVPSLVWHDLEVHLGMNMPHRSLSVGAVVLGSSLASQFVPSPPEDAYSDHRFHGYRQSPILCRSFLISPHLPTYLPVEWPSSPSLSDTFLPAQAVQQTLDSHQLPNDGRHLVPKLIGTSLHHLRHRCFVPPAEPIFVLLVH